MHAVLIGAGVGQESGDALGESQSIMEAIVIQNYIITLLDVVVSIRKSVQLE